MNLSPTENTLAVREGPDRQKQRLYDKAVYWANKSRGLCAYCGKAPPLLPSVACEACRKRHRRYSLLWSRRQKEMRRQGLLQAPEPRPE